MATYDEWLDAYSAAFEALPGPVSGACPRCGHRSLRLVFTGDPERAVGYAHFWCDHCLHGIGVSRTAIPAGAVVRDVRQPRDSREPEVPDYLLVQ